ISGGSIAGATLTTTGNTSVGGTLVVTGATTLNNSLTVAGTSTLADLVTSGQIKLTGNTADRLLIQPTVDPGASTKLFAIKNAVGTEQFSLSSDGRLNIVDSATIGGATTITGLLSANGGIVTGNAAINAGTGAISGGAITGATLTTSSNVSVGGDLTVLGTTITATNVTTFNCTDCIDFDDLADNLTLDGSTNILATGTNFLSLTNTGTGNSFLVSDQASDASPFVIDAAGNVGIGSSSPSAKLLVNLDSGVNGKILTLGRSAGAYVYSFGVDASSKFQILDNDGTTVRLNIDPTTGNLGINTSSPAATLHARTQSQASTGELLAKLDVSDATAGYLNIANGTTGDTAFIPYLSGRGTSNLIDLYLEGNAPVGGDTGSNPVVNINASINGAAVTTRPLLNINNNGSLKIQVD
ncbi:MAG TPA: hypothetical protein VFK94_05125, partial [Patescibacteria group bacterium]|nr:hypothetical protein [Patescibacteria group bacterium]